MAKEADARPLKDYRQLGREELYELVWSQSMVTLGKLFGVSDVGLKKRCKTLNVPTPPRGYWAKAESGHTVKRTPLPEAEGKINRRSGTLRLPPERGWGQDETTTTSAALSTTRAALRTRYKDQYGRAQAQGRGLLKTNASGPQVELSLKCWRLLIDALQTRGLYLRLDSETLVCDDRERTTVMLKERSTKGKSKSRQETDTELYFTTSTYGGTELVLSDPDTEKIAAYADTLRKQLLGQHLSKVAEAEKSRKRAEAEAIVMERERRRVAEEKRKRKLVKLAGRHTAAKEIRDMLASVSACSPEPDDRVQAWITWAEKVAKELDPAHMIVESVLAGKDPLAHQLDDDEETAYRPTRPSPEPDRVPYWFFTKRKFCTSRVNDAHR